MPNLEHTTEILAKHDQSHLLNYLNSLDIRKDEFLEYLDSFNYDEISDIFVEGTRNSADVPNKNFRLIQPEEVVNSKNWEEMESRRYFDRGMQTIGNERIGVVLFEDNYHPMNLSGTSKIGLVSEKSLYQIAIDKIIKMTTQAEKYLKKDVQLRIYVMVTALNRMEHEMHFRNHSFFGLDEDNVEFIEQEVVPCYSSDGKILLEDKQTLALTSNGSGGVMEALLKDKLIETILKNGVKYLFACTSTNLMQRMLDPYFIGHCIENGSSTGMMVCRYSEDPILGEVGKIGHSVTVKQPTHHFNKFSSQYRDARTYFFKTSFIRDVVSSRLHEIGYKTVAIRVPFSNGPNITFEDGVAMKKFIGDAIAFDKTFAMYEIPANYVLNVLIVDDKIPSYILDKYYANCSVQVQEAGGTMQGKVIEISPRLFDDVDELKKYVEGKTFKSHVNILEENEDLTTAPRRSFNSKSGRPGKSLTSIRSKSNLALSSKSKI